MGVTRVLVLNSAQKQNRPRASSEFIRKKMSDQKRRDTAPEMAIRQVLHARGLRYRVNYQLPNSRRRADIVFTRQKLAIFIDGCFWHSCPIHGSIPKKNRGWWVAKLQGNVQRDRDTDTHLRNLGWNVLRIWEHQKPLEAVQQIEAMLQKLQSN